MERNCPPKFWGWLSVRCTMCTRATCDPSNFSSHAACDDHGPMSQGGAHEKGVVLVVLVVVLVSVFVPVLVDVLVVLVSVVVVLVAVPLCVFVVLVSVLVLVVLVPVLVLVVLVPVLVLVVVLAVVEVVVVALEVVLLVMVVVVWEVGADTMRIPNTGAFPVLSATVVDEGGADGGAPCVVVDALTLSKSGRISPTTSMRPLAMSFNASICLSRCPMSSARCPEYHRSL